MLALALLALAQQPDPPKTVPADKVLKAALAERVNQFHQLADHLPYMPPDFAADILVYRDAVGQVWAADTWPTKDTGRQLRVVLEAGIKRAELAAGGKRPWRVTAGKTVVRGYRSSVDDTDQPFAVTFPPGYVFGKWNQTVRTDVLLHGRDANLTPLKFLADREEGKGPRAVAGRVIVEPYGRGNLAYRWAAETDVFEAVTALRPPRSMAPFTDGFHDGRRDGNTVLRGFSMGGAGAWHIGLHHPYRFSALQPGAGFTTTRGYVKGLPDPLPPHVEACLRIYDAVPYAENLRAVPAVAYSGGDDPQKAAADAVAAAVADTPLSARLTHLVAPGLGHKQPAEWLAKCDAELARLGPRKPDDGVRLVTFTPRYGHADWAEVAALDRQYERAVFEGRKAGLDVTATTRNVRAVVIRSGVRKVMIDEQELVGKPNAANVLVKQEGRWVVLTADEWRAERAAKPWKTAEVPGPIDDAFRSAFRAYYPQRPGWQPAIKAALMAELLQFGANWKRHLNGSLPYRPESDFAAYQDNAEKNLVLFGDPDSNPLIAEVLPALPIKWTRDTLEVNGVVYDSATHVPALIYPKPKSPGRYVVLNSGHTFGDAELTGSNALLYPRLGDWAVLKLANGKLTPVAAGLFDENWQFAAPKR